MSEEQVPEKKGRCHLPPPRKRDILPFVLAVVILLCGMVIGIGGTILFLRNQALTIIHNPEQLPNRITDLVQREYSLGIKQTEGVRQVLGEHLKELEILRQKTRPKVDEQLNAIRDEIAAIMGDEQGMQWHNDFEKLRGKWLAPLVDLSKAPFLKE